MYRLTCHTCGAVFHASNPRKYCPYHAHRGPVPSIATMQIVCELKSEPSPTYAEIAARHGLSRQRVGQIAYRFGIARRAKAK